MSCGFAILPLKNHENNPQSFGSSRDGYAAKLVGVAIDVKQSGFELIILNLC
jgi:hypothetical protein